MAKKPLQRIRGNQIAMVFQEPLTSLNPVFTIRDQIAEAIRTHETISDEQIEARCLQLLEDVGIPSAAERMSDYPHQLSGGQRQRVMIAMALACNPELIIADEPTTALDVTVQAQILKLLNTVQRERAMSVLYITHDLGVVSKVADRVYVMYAGIIVEQGDKDAYFSRIAASLYPGPAGIFAASIQARGKALQHSRHACRIRLTSPPAARFIRAAPMRSRPAGNSFPATVTTAKGIWRDVRCCMRK